MQAATIHLWIKGNDVTMLQDVKSLLCKCFSMKFLGEAAYIFRIKITHDRSKRLIALNQSAYFDKILKKFKMINSSSVPMQEKPNLSKTQGANTPNEFALHKNLYSRFLQNLDEAHWTAVKTILKYLRNTKDMVLIYGGKPETMLKVTCYTDASIKTNKYDTKSQPGHVFVLNGGVVDWKSAKQNTIAMSFYKAKYNANTKDSMDADRRNAVVLTWIMNSVSSNVYMGLVYSVDAESMWKELKITYDKELDLHNKLMKLMQFHMGLDECYLSVRSCLLTWDPLLEVKDTIVSREESHRGTPESSSLTESILNATSFVAKSSNTFKRALPTCSISKKRIKKLQHDRLLKSMDDESFDQCVSCLSGKIPRKPFLNRMKRATDLLGLIHTDVCGPLRHVSRQVFETFKVFKNEVENQLGKTIKALRLDRGGEYIGKEFNDYLKACEIVQQLAPPYTPQPQYVFIFNGGAADWESSKQSTTVMSAKKAEYITASEALMEAV
ncbi:retrotransposon protein, putative, ty1-copia subclass [Tanacetum coccineum]